MEKKLELLINEHEIISFDIFDTLITRIYREPTDLFRHLEESCECKGFSAARIAAEQQARQEALQNSQGEVTLEDIYDHLHSAYAFLREKEIELEILACKCNPDMYEVFQYAKKANKKIVIASDMYLSEETIETILANSGYDSFDKLFVSSSTKRPKATGQMYQDIVLWSHTSPSKILHIGDHPYTDFQVAVANGLSAFLYTPIKEHFGNRINSNYYSVLRKYDKDSIWPSILEGLTSLNECKSCSRTYWYNFGYKYGGIIAYSYMSWLHSELRKDHIYHAFFMLRDGYIFKRVFDELYSDIQTEEIYGSRRLFMFAGAEKIDDILPLMIGDWTRTLTYRELFRRFEISNAELKAKYIAAFPRQDSFISNNDINALLDFFKQHEKLILKTGKEERSLLMDYFCRIHLFDERCAVIDLGWKCSMLKAINRICSLEKESADIWGYFFGLHRYQPFKGMVKSFTVNQGEPSNRWPLKALANSYVVCILELLFSAPHPSILKLEQNNGAISPVYQESSTDEDKRIFACQEILSGILDFIKDLKPLTEMFPLKESSLAACIPLEYFATCISKFDEMQINQINYSLGVGSDKTSFPICKHGLFRIAAINPWPGDKSAESEVLTRMQKACRDIGIDYVILDDFGYILDETTQERTSVLVDPDSLDFAISTHYETPKTINTFYYHALWNPPEIPLNLSYYTERVTNNYIMNDDYLTYDSGGMRNHLKTMLLNCPRNIDDTSMLVASFPESCMLEPKLENPTMFYCGMNWEKVVHNSNRHDGLFKLLDQTQKVKFFGPDIVAAWGGLKPWEGYKCYQYSIPFDGFSILNEINQCGICLVISSDIHRRAGAVTNRAYEACAAGAVMISDENEFMLQNFSDAALFIRYNKNAPKDTFDQIMEKYRWILSHPEEALSLARRAQEIFRARFSLDKQLVNIINHHSARFHTIAEDLFARDERKTVLVTYVVNSLSMETAKSLIRPIIANCEKQYYRNIVLALAVDHTIAADFALLCAELSPRTRIIPMKLYDAKGARYLTNGRAIRILQNQIPHDYYINTNSCEIWFYDHITTLVRAAENQQALGAYSGKSLLHPDRFCRTEHFDIYSGPELASFDNKLYNTPGMFLFSNEAHEYVPDYMFDCIDGLEHFAYANTLVNRYQKKLAFTRRMTFVQDSGIVDNTAAIVPAEMQIRLIQDIIRFEMKESTTGVGTTLTDVSLEEAVSPVAVRSVLANFPIKLWIKLRYYQRKMWKTKGDTPKDKEVIEKYHDVYEKFKNCNN